MIDPIFAHPLLDREALAKRWNCSVSLLEKLPAEKLPLRIWVAPGRVMYRLVDVIIYESRQVGFGPAALVGDGLDLAQLVSAVRLQIQQEATRVGSHSPNPYAGVSAPSGRGRRPRAANTN